ncbi:metallophosphoesterase [Terriglobus aquaticus]|uniref:Metallophosphoesterase n=1 Tax=Terriglobus aquaticus TaxID=940139 RepID=A0ABW9KJH3_9BACT|nr:metallophosphoesterase [Terriglobus aquaticus]
MEQTARSRVLSLHRPNRREFLVGAAAIAASGLLLDATAIDRHHLVVEHQALHLRRLPTAFHGLRICQISDFHHRGYAEDDYLREVVSTVNALKPAVVALTGDFITAHGNPFGPWRKAMPVCAEILSGLKAPLRLCTLGNHDCINLPFVTRCLRQRGLTVLYNRHIAVDAGGDRLWFAGTADAYFDFPDLAQTVPVAKEREPVILLGHEPDFADVVKQYGGVDVMLAGHSHGGQVRLPGVTEAFLPVMGRRYVRGLFQLGDLQLYVNRGIGAVHLPIRFRCPPEITLFTLEPAA